MKKKAIALSGRGNVGKTGTIKQVFELLKSKHRITETNEINAGADITVIIVIGGVKIGIESQGDPGSRIFESLKLFVKEDCHIIICATRSWGATVDTFSELASDSYKLIQLWQVVKDTDSEQKASNKAMAERIVKEAEELILS
jgi:hypothetical protein